MGFNLLKQYGLSEEEIPEDVGRRTIPDGTYDYTVTYAGFKEGTDSQPDMEWIIIDFDLGEEGEYREWFTTVDNGDSTTDRVKNSMSFLRKRLAFFGQTLASIDFEAMIGATGTLTLSTTKKGEKSFQNISEFSIDEDDAPADKPMALARPGRGRKTEPEDEDEATEEDEKPRTARPAAKRGGDTPFSGRRSR